MFKLNVLNVESDSPVDPPFTNQSKVGRPPPNNGVEVTVIRSPLQIVVPELMLMLIEGVSKETTVTSMLLLVAVDGLGHSSLLVSTQVTTSPSTSVDVLKVVLSVPTLLPFTFH